MIMIVTITGRSDTLNAPEGDLRLALSTSRIREWTLDSVNATVGVHDNIVEASWHALVDALTYAVLRHPIAG